MEDTLLADTRFSIDPVELLVLEDRWNKGKLNQYVPLVRKFINEQQEKVRKQLGPKANDDLMARTLLELLLENGTLDHASEMLEQQEEILRECWIRAERGDYDRRRITNEWIQTHAPEWRRWRVIVYTFIAVKIAVQIYRDIDT